MLKNFCRETEVIREYSREFTYTDGDGGFSFPCDSTGKLSEDLHECAKKNYAWCMEHPERFSEFDHFTVDVRRFTRSHGICSCGAEVELWDQYYGACQCERCGQWYNLFGQSLLPPEQWEVDPSEEEYW